MTPITVEMVMEKLAQEKVIPTSGRLMAAGVGRDTPKGRVYDTAPAKTPPPKRSEPQWTNTSRGATDEYMTHDYSRTPAINTMHESVTGQVGQGYGDLMMTRRPGAAPRQQATADDIKKAKTSVRNMFLGESPAPQTSMIDKIRSTTGNLSGRYVNTARPMFGGQ